MLTIQIHLSMKEKRVMLFLPGDVRHLRLPTKTFKTLTWGERVKKGEKFTNVGKTEIRLVLTVCDILRANHI